VIAYLDASVLLRIVLGEPGRVKEWSRIRRGVASALTRVECLRTLDRLWRTRRLADADLADRRAAILALCEHVDLVAVDDAVLQRAAEPFPTPLGTLDAVHLATALLWRQIERTPLVMATHNVSLGLAARASGFDVVGTPR
jgi:predicted nucleic acid-binding protein